MCAETAKYQASPVPHYRGNPLIEALPPIMGKKELYKRLTCQIPYDLSIREQDGSVRKECISELYHFFQPWGVHIDIAERIGRAIRNGYVNRNPLTPVFNTELNQLSSCVHTRDSTFQSFHSTNPGASGFSLVGTSGSGKTSIVNRVLEGLYSQNILHSEYQGQPFHHLQIVWMKITCPFDGSVKGLCVKFFQEFDNITGDSTFQRFAGSRVSTIDTMLTQMALLAKRHSLGVLVIDEIQNINAAKSGGRERILNFLADLMDTMGIPIIVIGIPAAIQALSGSFMTARRAAGEQGTVKMESLKYGSDEWELFINAMWKYQWTSIETKLTDEMSELVNELSRGIVALALHLYAWTQDQAVENGFYGGSECITPEMFQQVAKSEKFLLMREQLAVMDDESMKKSHTSANKRHGAKLNCKATRKTPDKSLADPAVEHWDVKPENAVEKLRREGLIVTKDGEF
ncbi:MAG: ATP-binding protein [Oscillospiraceae bacterium]|nr:ATP-binding protein [Oscillospiraceae bacterium]